MAELFGPLFCIAIPEIWRTQILRHSLDFSGFYMIQQSFSQVFLKFPQIKEGRPNFLQGTNSAEQLNYFVAPSVFQLQKFEGLKLFVI